eukprot:9542058-Alexandrium_andersonii.AAC.1
MGASLLTGSSCFIFELFGAGPGEPIIGVRGQGPQGLPAWPSEIGLWKCIPSHGGRRVPCLRSVAGG